MHGLARLLCMHEGVEEATKDIRSQNASAVSSTLGGSSTAAGASENSTSPHRRHKERKKIKCPELKYNKFQPPVYDFRDGATTSTLPTPGGGGGAAGVGGAAGASRSTVAGVTQGGSGAAIVGSAPLQHSHVVETDVREIKRILRTYIGRLNDKDAQGRINKEWRVVARVLDRLFFFLYLATIIVSLATIFPRG